LTNVKLSKSVSCQILIFQAAFPFYWKQTRNYRPLLVCVVWPDCDSSLHFHMPCFVVDNTFGFIPAGQYWHCCLSCW
jgi:hypothetical protein